MSFIEPIAADLLQVLPECVLMVNASGTVKFANDSAQQKFGYSQEQFADLSITTLLTQSTRRQIDVMQWLARWADNPNSQELRYLALAGVSSTGEEYWFQIRVSSYQQAKQKYLLIVLIDITQQHAEKLVRRKQQLLTNRIIAIGEDAVLSIDEQFNICFCNPSVAHLFGYSEAELLGKPLSILLPDGLAQGHEYYLRQFSQDKAPAKSMGQRGEISGRTKDGRLLSLEAAITKTRIDGELYLSAQLRDIGERKKTQQRLIQRETQFAAVFNYAQQAMALLDANGVVVAVNNTARALLNSDAKPLGQPLWQLPWWQTGDSDAAQQLHAYVKKVADGDSVTLRTTLDSKQGLKEIDFSLTPILGDDRNLQYIIAEAHHRQTAQ